MAHDRDDRETASCQKISARIPRECFAVR